MALDRKEVEQSPQQIYEAALRQSGNSRPLLDAVFAALSPGQPSQAGEYQHALFGSGLRVVQNIISDYYYSSHIHFAYSARTEDHGYMFRVSTRQEDGSYQTQVLHTGRSAELETIIAGIQESSLISVSNEHSGANTATAAHLVLARLLFTSTNMSRFSRSNIVFYPSFGNIEIVRDYCNKLDGVALILPATLTTEEVAQITHPDILRPNCELLTSHADRSNAVGRYFPEVRVLGALEETYRAAPLQSKGKKTALAEIIISLAIFFYIRQFVVNRPSSYNDVDNARHISTFTLAGSLLVSLVIIESFRLWVSIGNKIRSERDTRGIPTYSLLYQESPALEPVSASEATDLRAQSRERKHGDNIDVVAATDSHSNPLSLNDEENEATALLSEAKEMTVIGIQASRPTSTAADLAQIRLGVSDSRSSAIGENAGPDAKPSRFDSSTRAHHNPAEPLLSAVAKPVSASPVNFDRSTAPEDAEASAVAGHFRNRTPSRNSSAVASSKADAKQKDDAAPDQVITGKSKSL